MFKNLQMINKELQDETKADSKQMPIVASPAQMPQNQMLSAASFSWVSIFIDKPKEGQKVASRISGQQGYVSECIYRNGYFETYYSQSNRFQITRWKHDEWAAI